jgi:hypothetical protein
MKVDSISDGALRIEGMELTHAGAGGIAAWVCIVAGPLRIAGCALKAQPDGTLRLYMPKAGSRRGRIMFLDRSLFHTAGELAATAFYAMGGDASAAVAEAKARAEAREAEAA